MTRILKLALALAVAPLGAALLGAPAAAETVVAAASLRPGVVLERRHLALVKTPAGPGALSSLDEAIGMETRSILYTGKPVRAADLGPPTLVRRNEIVTLEFRRGVLALRTEGRALDAGGFGERIRVMNLDSRRTVFGVVSGAGVVRMK